jgi:hypothetical protein
MYHTMTTIDDLRNWVDGATSDWMNREDDDVDRITAVIRDSDCPRWGADWSDYLQSDFVGELLEHWGELDPMDAREWYGRYGWHYVTQHEGYILLDAVEYDWLDGTDAEAIVSLKEEYCELLDFEAEDIIAKAREVREAGEAVESLLADAVQAYQRGNMSAMARALNEAAAVESQHGASPATDELRAQMQ